jgi:signal transduction histidine kinase/PAS domain-containing protein
MRNDFFTEEALTITLQPATLSQIETLILIGFDKDLNTTNAFSAPWLDKAVTTGTPLELVLPNTVGSNLLMACQAILRGQTFYSDQMRFYDDFYDVKGLPTLSQDIAYPMGILILQKSSMHIVNHITQNTQTMVYCYKQGFRGDGSFLYLSANIVDFFGVTDKQAYDDVAVVSSQQPLENAEHYVAAWKMAQQVKKPFVWEDRFKTLKGIRWFRIHSSPHSLLNGDVIWSGTVTDITNIKETARIARENQERAQFFIENSPDILFYQDLDEHGVLRYTWASASMGLSTEHILGASDADVFEVLEEAQPAISAKEKTIVTEESQRCLFKQTIRGQTFHFDARYIPRHDDAGRVIGIAGYLRDVTQQMNLVVSEQRHAALFYLLYLAAQDLYGATDLEEVLDQITTVVEMIAEHDFALLALRQDKDLQIARLRGNGQLTVLDIKIPVAMATGFLHMEEHRQSISLGEEWIEHFWIAPLANAGIKTMLAAPLIRKGNLTGAIYLYRKTQKAFTAQDEEHLAAFAMQGAIAIENAQLYNRMYDAGALNERQRLTRELHDSLSQTLFSANMYAQSLPHLIKKNDPTGHMYLEQLTGLTQGALSEVRLLLAELTPKGVYNLALRDLIDHQLKSLSAHSNCMIDIVVEGNGELPSEVHYTAYRVVQEALMNIRKHAQPKLVIVRLQYIVGGVQITIHDDGRGFDTKAIPGGKYGVRIMHERVDEIGGYLEIESEPGKGTKFTFSWQPDSI